MKKLLVISLLIISLGVSAQNAPNRGFEEWEDVFMFAVPDFWNTSNEERGTSNAKRSSDAHSGNYSILLENNTDSSFGYFYMGTVGEYGPDSGYPYVSDIDSITGYYKCDMKVGDSAQIYLILINASDTIMILYPLYGTVSNWTRFSFPLPPIIQTEVFFGVVSSNTESQTGFNAESWIMVDDVAFVKAGGPMPTALGNNSFESWDSVMVPEPVGWNTINFYGALTGDTLSAVKTTDAYTGNYALKLSTRDQVERKIGWAFTGNQPSSEGFTGGFPYNENPTNFSGYYKYDPVGIDTAMILIIGYNHDTLTDSSTAVFVGAALLLDTNVYTKFDIPLHYDTSTQTVNLINIVAVSSRYLFDNPELASIGSSLYLDDLWITSKCDYSDTTVLFSYADTTLSFTSPDTASFAMDSSYIEYLWSTGDTTYSIKVLTSPTNLSVQVKDSNGCTITDDLVIYLKDLASTFELSQNVLKYYPNPVRHKLLIQAEHNGTLNIYNTRGELLAREKVLAGSNVLDVRSLSSGNYVIEYVNNELNKKMRFVIIKY